MWSSSWVSSDQQSREESRRFTEVSLSWDSKGSKELRTHVPAPWYCDTGKEISSQRLHYGKTRLEKAGGSM